MTSRHGPLAVPENALGDRRAPSAELVDDAFNGVIDASSKSGRLSGRRAERVQI
jgi:hypothetical protein